MSVLGFCMPGTSTAWASKFEARARWALVPNIGTGTNIWMPIVPGMVPIVPGIETIYHLIAKSFNTSIQYFWYYMRIINCFDYIIFCEIFEMVSSEYIIIESFIRKQ